MLDEDLRRACLAALELSRADCCDFVLAMSWQKSARIFIEHVTQAAKTGQMARVAASISDHDSMLFRR